MIRMQVKRFPLDKSLYCGVIPTDFREQCFYHSSFCLFTVSATNRLEKVIGQSILSLVKGFN